MAQNVVIRGVTYSEVPKVDIPLSGGGGNAEFVDTSDATLSSGDQMLDSVTAYADGTKVTGSIQSKSSSDLTASGATVTAPAGYYSSASSPGAWRASTRSCRRTRTTGSSRSRHGSASQSTTTSW